MIEVLRRPVDSTLAPAVAVNDHGSVRLAPGNSGTQGTDGQIRGHAIAQRVADDPIREDILDAAGVELAFRRRVLRDIGEPGDVGSRRAEVSIDQIIVDGWTGDLSVAPALLGRRRPDPLVATEAVHAAFARLVAGALELVGDEAIPELGVVVVDVDDDVGQMRVVPIAVADWLGLPLVEGLSREAQHPAGHLHGEPPLGELLDQRVHHFGRVSLAK